MRRAILAFLLLLLPTVSPAAGEKPLWILVTAPACREALAPLAGHRRAGGARVVVLTTTDALSPEQISAGEAGPLRDRVRRLAASARGPVSILLAGATAAPDGADPAVAVATVVPPGTGAVGRMAGKPTDHPFGADTAGARPEAAVGRFPARSAAEAGAMAAKTLAFEKGRPAGPWRERVTLLVGDPGGSSPVERQMAALFLGGALSSRIARLPERFSLRALVHSAASPFGVPDDSLRDLSRRYLEEGAFLAIYLGHSGARGLWSGGAEFLTRDDFASLRIRTGPGILFTCGCYGCQTAGFGGEGYGLAAARNPTGPAAVIGAHGESYAVMGRLAADGLMEGLRHEPPATLGELWLEVLGGIADRAIDGLTFRLYDEADGSRGRVPLAEQRREHLEMWTLLGDPGMRLPPPPLPIPLVAEGIARPGLAAGVIATPGGEIAVRGVLPAELAGARVEVTLERPPGPRATGLLPLPADPRAAREAMLANHDRANDVVLSAVTVSPRDVEFRAVLPVPGEVPWSRLSIRARAQAGDAFASGVLSVAVHR